MENLRLFLLSLLAACLVWVMHTFSLEYSASMSYTVSVTTNMEGYAPSAVARETLILRGKATGFYILKNRGFKHRPASLELTLDASNFRKAGGEDDVFELNVQDIRDKISEQMGDKFDMDFLESSRLTFVFEPQDYVKLPVMAALNLSFKPQYMQVGEVRLRPDSVLVYGAEKELRRITHVGTRSINFTAVDKNLQGFVGTEPVAGLRIDCERVYYDISVDRYVESTLTLPVTAKNVPAGRTLMILPSRVNVTMRTSFRPGGGRISGDDLELVVDWNDFAGAESTKVIPRLVTAREIYSWRLSPELVECIQLVER